MRKPKLYDIVRITKDKDFLCPVERVKEGAEGTIVMICEAHGKTGYLVEIENEVYDFQEDEFEING